MKTFTKYFLNGILTLLPLFLTIYPLYYFLLWSDSIVRKVFVWALPDMHYVTGAGVTLGLIAIFVLGLLMSTRLLRGLIRLTEELFTHIPLVKTLYTAIRDLTHYLAPGQDQRFGKVVAVQHPAMPVQLIGFVMRSDLQGIPEGIDTHDKAVVYIPMSYQVGGFTFFLPQKWLTPVDMSVEDAMKQTLTGWISK